MKVDLKFIMQKWIERSVSFPRKIAVIHHGPESSMDFGYFVAVVQSNGLCIFMA